MRRIWNSWTYYGPDRESARDEPDGAHEAARRRDKTPRRRALSGRAEGSGTESAFQQSNASALERAMDLCDARNERLERVKRELLAGTYRVPARELAQKLIANMLGEYR